MALESMAPDAQIVLAGSLAFDEPWACRGADGGWKLESDYDLYLVMSNPLQALTLASDPALGRLGATLRTRAPVDPFVIWRPLVVRGLAGMVGRDLRDGTFVQCPLDRCTLRTNQLRKALLRSLILAPREQPDRARYQIVKAAIEALRAIILASTPDLSNQAVFSIHANLRWIRAHGHHLEAGDSELLGPLLGARLDLEGSGPSPALLLRTRAWLERFAQTRARQLLPPRGGWPRPTAARSWLGLLGQRLVPDPRIDYDRALLELLADPLTARAAADPAERRQVEERWRHLWLVGFGPDRQGALLRALDHALGNPGSAKGERYLAPDGPVA